MLWLRYAAASAGSMAHAAASVPPRHTAVPRWHTARFPENAEVECGKACVAGRWRRYTRPSALSVGLVQAWAIRG
jgi:hypothetical protein